MKIKQKLSVLAASLLLVGCTTENGMDNPLPDGGSGSDDASRREVLMTLKNKLNLVSTKTKADDAPIATAEENYIRSLDVYVFGSETEDGTYTFQELYYYRDDASTIAGDGDWAHSFSITAVDGKDNLNSGLLRLKKGLYVKLYCIANRTALYQTAADGSVSLYENFDPLIQTAPGQPENKVTPGVPTEEDFKKFHSAVIDPTGNTEDDVLINPLPMTGSYVTPLDLTDFSVSARTQLSFKLSRMVARFDVINDAALSKFTLESISMGNGQPGSGLFPIKALVTDKAKLITYPVREISADTQTKDASETKGAFYTWPSPKDNEGYLILKGKYAVNKTEIMDVSYQVPFQQIKDGVGSYIEVAYNHRYTLGITKADTYHLDFTLNVADWDEGADIDDYEPDNAFDPDAKVTLIADAGESVGSYVLDNGKISVLPQANSKFAFNISSNAALKEELIYKSGSAKWIVKDEAAVTTSALMTNAEDEAVTLPTGTKETKYAFKVDEDVLSDNGPLLPVTIRLTNLASGEYKNIIVIPTTGPEISWTAEVGNFNYFDSKAMKAWIYNVANQTLKLTVNSETRGGTTGCTAAINDASSWLSGSEDLTAASAEYTLTLGTKQDEPSSATATVTFTSNASNVASEITVGLMNPAITALAAKDFASGTGDNTFADASSTGSNAKVTMANAAEKNSFTLTVTSPEGITANVGSSEDWMTVTCAEKTGSKGNYTNTVMVTLETIESNSTGTIVLKNAITGADDLTVDIEANVPPTIE